jgi:hypothetical protein
MFARLNVRGKSRSDVGGFTAAGRQRATPETAMPPASPSANVVAELGQDSFDGANAALDLVNDKGGVGGRRVEWVKAEANRVIR